MTSFRLTRRAAISLAVGGVLGVRAGGSLVARERSLDWFPAPIGRPGKAPGDGFRIGHGFACENTWFSAGWWHTGEDWYAIEGDTGGAAVYALAAGDVVYADFNYPGRVVIVQHAPELYSMYGHLDPALEVRVGQAVAAGDQLGVVLGQPDIKAPGQAPSHLHLELRTFLTRDDVNGNAPQFGVNCGFQCPPGPGYWPIPAPQHPAELGWRNPVLGRIERLDASRLVLRPHTPVAGEAVPVLAGPGLGMPVRERLALEEASRLTVTDIVAGNPAGTGTSAETYKVWMKIEAVDGIEGWVQAVMPSDQETGSDGRPSSVDLPFLMVGT